MREPLTRNRTVEQPKGVSTARSNSALFGAVLSTARSNSALFGAVLRN